MKEFRCKKCNHLFFEGDFVGVIKAKCPKSDCKHMNTFTVARNPAPSTSSVERDCVREQEKPFGAVEPILDFFGGIPVIADERLSSDRIALTKEKP
jgi:phage FluMu protein Com